MKDVGPLRLGAIGSLISLERRGNSLRRPVLGVLTQVLRGGAPARQRVGSLVED